MGRLPTALFVGPMRAGTTWVHQYLVARGDVCLPRGVKETFFFDRYWSSGVRWYASHFRHFDELRHVQVVEVAPSYFCVQDAPARILQKLGTVKIAVMARDPIERSWSHFLHLRRYGLVDDDIRRAVDLFPDIVDASRYSVHVPRWSQAFGPQSLHLFNFDDVVSSPAAFERQVEDFLGLPIRDWVMQVPPRTNVSVTAPRAKWLARSGRWVASFLRRRQFYAAVNFAKRLRFDRLFYGGGERSVPRLRDQDRVWLEEVLANEYESGTAVLYSWSRRCGR